MRSNAQSSPPGWRSQLEQLFKPAASELTPGEQELGERLGTVKRFWEEKGYGFIVDDRDGLDHFVHYRDISSQGYRNLATGQRVAFLALVNKDGRRAAREVRVVNS